ncbi:hypothetical protein PR048_031830 [Dryococelus australis]|uniref:PiggyBac transposable element-derived protein domain-containing protein n=1 Tax=Dryococelus australis TaxID=614101 RepID=A0ABQ9GAG1_9NEOP|nr:hypothetical protein PR048_031830 [Dryococelus australis]
MNRLMNVKPLYKPMLMKLNRMENGIMNDFVSYQGSTTELDKDHVVKFEPGAYVVLHLTSLVHQKNHKLFFDNYFTLYNLLEVLASRKIWAAGTVRTNQFANPPLTSDTEIKKERDYAEEICSKNGDIVMVKWSDNRPVVQASNFISVGEMDEVKRIFIKSKKWTLRIIFHAVGLAVVNSWLEYRKEARLLSVPSKDILDLLHFCLHLAESLILERKPVTPRPRGWPSRASEEFDSPPPPKKVSSSQKCPIPEVQHDLVDHLQKHSQQASAGCCK